MAPTTAYDRYVLKALGGTSREQPEDLADIILGVDARERIALSYDELRDALRRLIEGGKVAQAKPLHYFVATTKDPSGVFSEITPADYEAAMRTAHERMQRAVAEADESGEEPGRPLVVIRWHAARGNDLTDDDEDAVEQLAAQLEALIPEASGAEIIGFETDPGDGTIDILIWGDGTNELVDQIYEAVLPAYQTFGVPKGSIIIRHYDGGEREFESDLV